MHSSESQRKLLLDRIYHINEKEFDTVAKDVAGYQYTSNPVYREYCNLLGTNPVNAVNPESIPFLPVSMFRDHIVQTGEWSPQAIFQSSGTTQASRSRHFVRDLDGYHKNAIRTFKNIFGEPADYNWIALMPSYLDNPDSSLISMVNAFMQQAQGKENIFFPEVNEFVVEKIEALCKRNEKTILFGVSF